MSNAQLTFGLMSGVEKVRPWAEGDVLVKHNGRRCIITQVSDDIHGQVAICIALDNGADCVVLEREVAYRTTVGPTGGVR